MFGKKQRSLTQSGDNGNKSVDLDLPRHASYPLEAIMALQRLLEHGIPEQIAGLQSQSVPEQARNTMPPFVMRAEMNRHPDRE